MNFPLTRYRQLFGTYLKPQWPMVLFLVLLLFSSIGLSLLGPSVLRLFIDEANATGPLQTLISIALLFLVVAFARQIISIFEGYVSENVALTTTNALRADLMFHCLHLDPSFHTAHTPGELIERIDGDVSSLGNFFSRFLISLLGNLLLLIGVLAIFFVIDWRVGLVLTIFAIVTMVIVDRLRNLSTPLWEKKRQASAELFGFIEERLSGTEDIRSSGATSYMVRGLAEYTRARFRIMLVAFRVDFISWSTMTVMVALGMAVALGLGVYLYSTKAATVGIVYMIFNYTALLNMPLEQITHQLRDLQQTAGSMKRIFDLFALSSVITDGEGATLSSGALSVAFDEVSFSYHEDVPVLKGIDFLLAPGTVMGLLGRTGSGKSTMTKLLTRLYDPDQGAIRLDGADLRALRLDELRERVGMVTQDVHILHASVRDNLTFFDPTIPDARIVEALETLGLGLWYKTLPEGLDAKLAPGGTGLSAGEAQLLSFARVFLRDPGLVILDEASSRLDPATERQLERAIDLLLEGRTAIIIAHRLATVQRADTIMILEDGCCCEYGTRAELARHPDSRFAQLLRAGLEEVLA